MKSDEKALPTRTRDFKGDSQMMTTGLFDTSRLLAISWLVGTFMAFGLSGCNTTQGFGEDVEAAGDAIEDAAEEAEDELD